MSKYYVLIIPFLFLSSQGCSEAESVVQKEEAAAASGIPTGALHLPN